MRFADLLHGGLKFVALPASMLHRGSQFFQYTTGYRIKRGGGLFIDLNGPLDQREMGLFQQRGQGLGLGLQRRQRGAQPVQLTLGQGGATRGRQIAGQLIQKRRIVHLRDVISADMFQLLEVQPRGRLADPAKVGHEYSQQQVIDDCRKQIEIFSVAEGGFILSSGCEFPPNGNLLSARTMVQTAKVYGRY